MTIKQPSYFFSAWEDYKQWEGTCPDCNWTDLLSQAVSEYESDMVSSLHCPECDRKIALMNNEASHEEIEELAARGSSKAIHHLKRKAELKEN